MLFIFIPFWLTQETSQDNILNTELNSVLCLRMLRLIKGTQLSSDDLYLSRVTFAISWQQDSELLLSHVKQFFSSVKDRYEDGKMFHAF